MGRYSEAKVKLKAVPLFTSPQTDHCPYIAGATSAEDETFEI